MAGALGHSAQMGMAASSPATEAYDFISEDVALVETLVDLSGFRGTRSHPSERVRSVQKIVQGSITMHPTPVDLDNLLPRILGAAESTDVFALAETIPSFFLVISRGGESGGAGKVFSYTSCYINRATFSSGEGQPLTMTLDILGTSESVGAAGSFPAITISDASVPYIFSELVLSVASTGYSVKNWTLTVDNALETQFFNSITPTRFNATDRMVTVDALVPYGDTTALYGLANTGVAVTATFTNGNRSILFTTPKVSFPERSPTVANTRGEIFLSLSGVARKDGSTAELTITSDSSG